MRSTPETGGPAFPMYESNVEGHIYSTADGLTMRDYFAAKAMAAILTSPNCPGSVDEKLAAKYAFDISDAMLEARK